MILVDTSVWIQHVTVTVEPLAMLLQSAAVMTHPLIIGELVCGDLGRPEHNAVLEYISSLAHAEGMSHEQLLPWIRERKLYCQDVRYIDMHLLAAAHLGHARALWTFDKKLLQMANRMGVAYRP